MNNSLLQYVIMQVIYSFHPDIKNTMNMSSDIYQISAILFTFFYFLVPLPPVKHIAFSLIIASRSTGFIGRAPTWRSICCVDKLKHCLASGACFKLPAFYLMTQAAKASLGRQRQNDRARQSDAQKELQDE